MNLKSFCLTAGLCLARGVFGDHMECDESVAGLELMILQDATRSFESFIEKTHTFIPNFLSNLRRKPRSLTISAAMFGDKPTQSYPEDQCFEPVLKRDKDYTKSSADGDFTSAMSVYREKTQQKWIGSDLPEDSASAIAHSCIQGDYFSKKTENDGIVRVVMVITDDKCKVNNRHDMGLDSLRTKIPCERSDFGRYPSDHDVQQALKTAAVTPLVVLLHNDTARAPHFREDMDDWQHRLKAWEVSTDNIVLLDINSPASTMETFFTHALRNVTCHIIHDMPIPSTSPTTPATATPVSTIKASSNKTGKIIGAVAGASVGAMLLGGAAYFGVQTMTAAPQAANFNMPDIEQQHNGRVQQGNRESTAVPDETFFQ